MTARDDDDDDGQGALVVPAALDGARADRAVASLLDVGTSAARRLLEAGRVRAGRSADTARRVKKGDPVRAGDVVVVGGGGAWFVPAPASVAVLYEDADVVVVDKPAGVPCHPLVPGEGGTVVDALIARYPELARVSPAGSAQAREGGLVHRLDTGTSGCLAFARTGAAHGALRAAFSSAGDVDKRYLALVSGAPPPSTSMTGALAHDPRDRRRMIIGDGDGGRSARSDARVVAQAAAHALVEVRLVGAGRRHQIRAHLAGAGWPIVGDALYGGEDGEPWPLLHAMSLTLPGKTQIKAKVPSAFAKACALRGLTLPEGAI